MAAGDEAERWQAALLAVSRSTNRQCRSRSQRPAGCRVGWAARGHCAVLCSSQFGVLAAVSAHLCELLAMVGSNVCPASSQLDAVSAGNRSGQTRPGRCCVTPPAAGARRRCAVRASCSRRVTSSRATASAVFDLLLPRFAQSVGLELGAPQLFDAVGDIGEQLRARPGHVPGCRAVPGWRRWPGHLASAPAVARGLDLYREFGKALVDTLAAGGREERGQECIQLGAVFLRALCQLIQSRSAVGRVDRPGAAAASGLGGRSALGTGSWDGKKVWSCRVGRDRVVLA